MSQLQQILPMMFLIFVVICIAYTIKAVVDARTQTKLIASNPSDELIRALLVDEKRKRRHASLRWGIVLSFLAGGFGLIEFFGWQDVTPGAIAILLGATGIGNLAFHVIERKLSQDERDGSSRAKSM